MTRWTRRFLLLAACTAAATAAIAQQAVMVNAPKDVKPGVIAVSATPPLIAVDGKDDRFSPGVRIHDRQNMLVLTGAVAGRSLYTVYKRDSLGLVHEVWLLNQDEFAKVGGVSTGDPDGYKRFQQLLDAIWASRWLLLK